MIGKKINQLATELAPVSTDLTIIGDPTTGVSKKITLAQLGAIFSGAVSFYTNLAAFPNPGTIDVIYCAKDTKKLYLWSGSAYVEVFPSQALLDTYQLRSEKGVSNGYASLDSGGKVPISQLPSSIMEYKGTWNAATNTPTLANGTGDTGDVYLCNVAGTVNFGAGPITFAVGDYVIYSGSIWQRSSGAVGTVTSVAASITGDAIGITGSPITTSGTLALAFAGNSTQYVNGAGNLVTFPGIINEAQNLITEVYNKTGATLTKGTVVYINGGQGNLPTVTKALATGDSTSAQTYGIVRNDITNNNNGYVVVAGRISDLDTQVYTEGTQLYLSPTTAGTFTSTKPYAPQHLVYVGIVVRAHPTQGVIEVKIQNGYEMDELHNVAAQSPDNNDILQYKTATSLWTKVAGTTSNIAEGSNLYYTDARSRAAISLTTTGTSGDATYNNTTGVFNIPNYGSALTGFVPYTGATTSVNLGTNNITAQNYLLNGNGTTTGSYLAFKQYNSSNSGIDGHTSIYALAQTSLYIRYSQLDLTSRNVDLSAALLGTTARQYLFPDKNGTFAMLSDIPALTGYVTGSGTNNYIAKFTSTGSVIGNSQIIDNGTSVLIGASGSIPNVKVVINSTTQRALEVVSTNTNALFVQSPAASIMTISNGTWSSNFTNTGRLDLAGDLLINTIANATTDTDKFLVSDGGVVKYRTATEFISDIGGPYVSSVAALTIGTTGTDLSSTVANSTTTPVITLNVPTASATNRGALSSADWTTFNNKQSALTNPVTGTGTTNYLPKFTGTSTIGNSILFDNGTNVGINTTTPTFSTGYTTLSLNGSTGGQIEFKTGDVGKNYIYSNSTDLRFFTSGGAFRFDGGNLGLGVTPSAWGSSFRAFEILGGSIFSTSTQNIIYLQNAYNDGTGFKYITSDTASQYRQANGEHRWFNAPSGTAGNAISFTQAMTLNASGFLGIGDTSPAERLSVAGAIMSTGAITGHGANRTTLSQEGANGAFWQSYGANTTTVGTFTLRQASSDFSVVRSPLIIASTGAATFSSSVTANAPSGSSDVFKFISASSASGNGSLFAYSDVNGVVNGIGSNYSVNSGGGTSRPNTSLSAWAISMDNRTSPSFSVSYINTSGTFSTPFTIASTGNVGIGTTSPNGRMTVVGNTVDIRNGAGGYGTGYALEFSTNATIPRIDFIDNGVYTGNIKSSSGVVTLQNSSNNALAFGTNNAERMRITSGGNVLVGTTNSDPSGSGVQGIAVRGDGILIVGKDGAYAADFGRNTSDGEVVRFRRSGTTVGSISVTGSATAYNTSSDYRLKTDLKDFSGLDLVSKIKAYDYEWKADKTRSYGVIAHELQSVINYAVTGVKDGKEMQGVDYSKIVPVLIKAIQELNDKIK